MRLRASDKANLYGGLAKMVRAGFGVPKAADTMLSQRHPKGSKLYLQHLKDSLAAGSDLTRATGSVPLKAVSQLEKEIVAAGEKGGQIETAYTHLADYFEVVNKTTRQIRRKLYYPLILLSLAVVLPALPKAVASKDPAPVIQDALILLGIVYAGLVVLFFIGRFILRSARTSILADNFLYAIPLVGEVRRKLSLARFCKVFHIYLLSGFRISDTLRSAGAASASCKLGLASERLAQAVEAGSGFSGPLSDSREFDPAFRSAFATAEEAGDLDGEAKRWSILLTEESREAVERLGEWAPRIFYVMIAIFVIYRIFELANMYFDQIRSLP